MRLEKEERRHGCRVGIKYDQMHGEFHGRGGGKIVELDGRRGEHGPQDLWTHRD